MGVEYEGFGFGSGVEVPFDATRIRIDVPASDLPRLRGLLAMIQKEQDNHHRERVASLPLSDLIDEACDDCNLPADCAVWGRCAHTTVDGDA